MQKKITLTIFVNAYLLKHNFLERVYEVSMFLQSCVENGIAVYLFFEEVCSLNLMY